VKKYTISEIKRYILSQDSLGDVLYNLKHEKIDYANIEICKNCLQKQGEECGINGREIFDDDTCENFCYRF